MAHIAIRVEKLSKQYRIGMAEERHDTLRDQLSASLKAMLWANGRRSHRTDTIWALKDISFEVKQGEIVGIIGRNGSGKSTLLKILSRITEPTAGRAQIYGRIGSLLEVGTGFHPELTGRENVYLNGAILGMKKKEIDRKFDEIVAFSELQRFIDTPVKRYSSGMYVRLAFAVAAHLEPEILVIDEVLAVGDVGFQKKCQGKIHDLAAAGRTVLLVSHDLLATEHLCRKVVLLDAGSLIHQGNPRETINRYLKIVLPPTIEDIPLAIEDIPLAERERSGNGRIRLTSFHIEDEAGNKLQAARSGMDVVFVFGFQCRAGDRLRDVDVGFAITANNDQLLFVLTSSYVGQVFETVPASGVFRCHVSKLPLSFARYSVQPRVTVAGEEADWPSKDFGYLDVKVGDFYGTGSLGFNSEEHDQSFLLVSGRWEVDEGRAPGRAVTPATNAVRQG